MLPPTAVQDFDALPPHAKQQVLDFIAFIKSRYQPTTKKTGLTPDSSFGAIKVKRRVSLEQMEQAIRKAGSTL